MRLALTLDRDASRREENDYVRALVAAGVARAAIDVVGPGRLPDEPFDGLLLGGGCDVEPARYGREPLPDAKLELDAQRDETDFAFLTRARAESVPVFGICRGLQVINVAFGGTLVQDLPSLRPSPVVHQRPPRETTRLDHPVSVRPGTRLAKIARAAEIRVNSRHHQAIEALAPGLAVSAEAADGLIEAVETAGVLAVQWHPENLSASDPVSQCLFEDFVSAVAARQRAILETASLTR